MFVAGGVRFVCSMFYDTCMLHAFVCCAVCLVLGKGCWLLAADQKAAAVV